MTSSRVNLEPALRDSLRISMCYTCNYYYNIIVYTAMVGLAATSLIYEKWFQNNNYYLYQLVTALIGSAVCPESYIIHIIDCYIFSLNILFTYVLCTFPKINIHSFMSSNNIRRGHAPTGKEQASSATNMEDVHVKYRI